MKTPSVFILMVLMLMGCEKESTAPKDVSSSANSSLVIVEGTAIYFVGGGTVEHIFPAGYMLIGSEWISPSNRSDSGFSVYLSVSMDSSYLNRRVRAFGTLDSIPVPWMLSNYVEYARKINVDSLRLVS